MLTSLKSYFMCPILNLPFNCISITRQKTVILSRPTGPSITCKPCIFLLAATIGTTSCRLLLTLITLLNIRKWVLTHSTWLAPGFFNYLDTIFPFILEEASLWRILCIREEVRKIASLHILESQDRSKLHYGRRYQETSHARGDLVLLWIPQRQRGLFKNLLSHYAGPFAALDRLSCTNYVIFSLVLEDVVVAELKWLT